MLFRATFAARFDKEATKMRCVDRMQNSRLNLVLE
jgi:hypothetical protein